MATNTYVALDKVTVGTATPSITFNAIPQTYTDLMIVANGLESANQYVGIRFNSDTATNYSQTRLYSDGSSINSDTQTTATFGRISAGDPTNRFAIQVSVPNYKNATTYKTWLSRTNMPNNMVGAIAGLWRKTPEAITSITITTASADNFSVGTTFSLYGITAEPVPTAKATGGTITYGVDGYTYHTFTSSGTFTPLSALVADMLVVAGGGGGGADMAGGGGAGGLLGYTAQSLTTTAYSVTVGAGGAGSPGSSQLGSSGANSQFGALTASVGGGRSGNYASTTGASGGSGGGAGRGTGTTGGAGTSGQGFAGGNGSGVNYDGETGGGGGAGSVGGNGNGSGSGDGGVGLSTYSSWGSITSTGQNVSGTYYYAGGGGGGWQTSSTVTGSGGYGGGGNGAAAGVASIAGTANTGGGGGGGAGGGSLGRAGGSGVVIIRYASV